MKPNPLFWAKIVVNGCEHGIIKTERGEMLRKKSNDKIEPMPKKLFQKIVKAFKRQGKEIRMDEDVEL